TGWLGPLLPYRAPKHGDVVVFLTPADPPGTYLVKRIIGLPNDHIHLEHGAVFRNGEKLNEPYAQHTRNDEDPFRDEFPKVSGTFARGGITPEWMLRLNDYVDAKGDLVVPQDRYFAMGDNRDVSRDSRYWGFIPKENLVGRPMFIYWSFD